MADPAHDAELDDLVEQLERAGLITVTTRPDGREARSVKGQVVASRAR